MVEYRFLVPYKFAIRSRDGIGIVLIRFLPNCISRISYLGML
jgi:hypothetical protein